MIGRCCRGCRSCGAAAPAVINRWVELASAEPDDRRRATLGYEVLVFAEKSADVSAWKRALEGWAVVKSQVIEATREEGRIEERQQSVLRLRTRQEVPAELAERVRACGDVAQLGGWFDAAATHDTLDDFRRLTGL